MTAVPDRSRASIWIYGKRAKEQIRQESRKIRPLILRVRRKGVLARFKSRYVKDLDNDRCDVRVACGNFFKKKTAVFSFRETDFSR